MGRSLERLAKYPEHCLMTRAYRKKVPVTVHVAVGTDTPHTYPQADGAAIGSATHHDFRLFATLVRELNGGGVYVNAGSAVVLPEVFLKAVSVVRNLGYPLANFTTVNFGFLQHYRPKVNVVERPHKNAGGKGYSITGHHEIMIPLLAALLVETEYDTAVSGEGSPVLELAGRGTLLEPGGAAVLPLVTKRASAPPPKPTLVALVLEFVIFGIWFLSWALFPDEV